MTEPDSAEQRIFEAARKLGSAEQRRSYLLGACGDDDALRQRVTALLQAYEADAGFLESAAIDAGAVEVPETAEMARLPAADVPGTTIGPYKLLQEIGQGGMGVVFMAEQSQPVRRRVALKIIKPGMDSRQVIARFEAERQALSLMDHPHIARVLDAGTTSTGRPYFVMELVKGQPITEYCDQCQLSLNERLKLFVTVCEAIQHAHQKGVIHRDIKPSNVLVAEYDGRPAVKVIDFGVAKAISQPLTERTMFTGLGQIIGTLEYMSPEQARVNQLDIDTRSDVYSLGVLLYELLTGTTPLDRKRMVSAAFDEMLRMIREDEPPRPSNRLSESREALPAISAHRRTDPAKLSRFVRGDLDWIVMKALDKERARRYDSANGLARDLDRFLQHEPVEATPPTSWYRLRKFVRRHRAAMSVILLGTTALSIATVVSAVSAIHATRAEAAARRSYQAEVRLRQEADDQRRVAEDALREEAEQRVRGARRDRTREALDDMTSAITGNALIAQVDLTDEQKRFLSGVLAYYQDFADERPDSPAALARTASAATRLAVIEFRLGRLPEALAAFRKAEERLEQLLETTEGRPQLVRQLAGSQNDIGIVEEALGNHAAAEAAYLEAIRNYESSAVTDPQADWQVPAAACHSHLGMLLARLGRQSDAIQHGSTAVRLMEAVDASSADPSQTRLARARCQGNLATILIGCGQPVEAMSHIRDATSILEGLVADHPDDPVCREELAVKLNNVGIIAAANQDRSAAERSFREALRHRELLQARYPGVTRYALDQARTLYSLALLLAAKGEDDEAAALGGRSIAILESMLERRGDSLELRHELARSRTNMGTLMIQFGRSQDGVELLERALDAYHALAVEFRGVPQYRQEAARCHGNLAAALTGLGRRSDALPHHLESLELKRSLAADFGRMEEYRQDLGFGLNNLGSVLVDLKRYDEAESALLEAVQVRRALADGTHATPQFRVDLAMTYLNLAMLETRLRRLDRATEWYASAASLLEDNEAAGRSDVTSEFLRRGVQRGRVKIDLLNTKQLRTTAEELVADEASFLADDWYDVASIHALSHALDPAGADDPAKLVVECLEQAFRLGWRDFELLATDDDFDSLREDEGLRRFIRENGPQGILP